MSLIFFSADAVSGSERTNIRINGSRLIQAYQHDQSHQFSPYCEANAFIKRGDYVQLHGASIGSDEES